MPARTSPRSPTPPPQLNDRQRVYLLAAYKVDQMKEASVKAAGAMGHYSGPASEWRLIPYGRWQHRNRRPPTELRALIQQERPPGTKGFIDSGAGSTWKALADRGLVEVEDRLVGFEPYTYVLPHIRLTRAGRKLVRELTQEVRPKSPPRKAKPKPVEGLLTDWQWRALVVAYDHDELGVPANDIRCLSYAGIDYNTWYLLSTRGLVRGEPYQMLMHDERQHITEQGRDFYHRYFSVNAAAHPRQRADVPRAPLTAEQRAYWQGIHELNLKRDRAGPVQDDINAVRREMLAFQLTQPLHVLAYDGKWYMAQAGRAIPKNRHEAAHAWPFDTEAEALAYAKRKMDSWREQITWLT